MLVRRHSLVLKVFSPTCCQPTVARVSSNFSQFVVVHPSFMLSYCLKPLLVYCLKPLLVVPVQKSQEGLVSGGASVADVMDQSISAGIFYIARAQFLNPTNHRRVRASGLGGHSQHAGLWSCCQPAHGVRSLAADTLCNLVADVILLLICPPQHHPAYSSSLLDATSPHVISYVLLHDLHIVQTATGGRAF